MNTTQPFSIQLNAVSKKFGPNWIFKNISYQFYIGNYAITGPNGSGKSTLLKIIAGMVTPNAGASQMLKGPNALAHDERYRQITFCAPYAELPEELSLTELLKFHQSSRQLTITPEQFFDEVQLEKSKLIKDYSSGMKQRLKLALALFTQTQAILLDEPSATLDSHWHEWYITTAQKVSAQKIIIISSNLPAEYSFCNNILNIADYKS